MGKCENKITLRGREKYIASNKRIETLKQIIMKNIQSLIIFLHFLIFL